MNILKKLILCLIIIEIVLSAILAYSALTKTTLCVSGFDCGAVQDSVYGKIFGIKLSYLGVFAFTGLLIVFFLSLKYPKEGGYLFLASATIGGIGAACFLFIAHSHTSPRS